ncbi:hypothetical protein C8F01DRAFT_1098715 [Mycena amicta]|nr:hypothetical protein C8F01DRAFT_1098715 [Mycena amicta]
MNDAAQRAADRARLSELDTEIQSSRSSSPPAALAERNRIQRRLDGYKYPVLTLPTEIVTEIFARYIPPYPLRPPMVGKGSPTYLLGVCRLWRTIALHSSLLWRAIELGPSAVLNEHMALEAIQVWLGRSGSSALSLCIDFHRRSVELQLGEALLQAVIAHRSRWEYVTFRALGSHLPMLQGPTPCLVEMDIMQWTNLPSTLNGFSCCPRLRSVRLWDVGHSVSSLPWGQLTSLTLIAVHLYQCTPILEEATRLLQCKLILRSVSADKRNIRLPRLEILLLDTGGTTDIYEDCLIHFTLPSLRKLEITEHLFGQAAVDQLRSLVTRSQCPLERLRVTSTSDSLLPPLAVPACRAVFADIAIDAHKPYPVHNDVEWKTEEYWDANRFGDVD